MTILSMLFGGCFSGCFGGYRMGGCNKGFPMGDYNNILMKATMQTMGATMQTMGAGLFGFGFNSGMLPGVATAPIAPAGVAGGGGTAHTGTMVTQAQVDEASKHHDNLGKKYLLALKYKEDPNGVTADSLAKTTQEKCTLLVAAQGAHSDALDKLLAKQAKLEGLKDDKEIEKINAEIQKLQKTVREKQIDVERAAEEVQKAQDAEEAFKLSLKENEEKLEALKNDVNEAYKIYLDLQAKLREQKVREANENAVSNARDHDKTKSGSWLNRTLANPANWGKTRTKIAKTLDLLHSEGRDAALKYAMKKGLIKLNGKKYESDYPKLQGLCDLFNTADPGYPSATT